MMNHTLSCKSLNSLKLLVLLGLLCTSLFACGTVPTAKKQTLKKPKTELGFNPLGDLLKQAQSALKNLEDPDPNAQARVSFALLHKDALPQTEADQLALTQAHFSLSTKALKNAGVNSLASSKLAERFQVLSLSVQDDLPINLKVLNNALSRLKAQLSDFKGISIISYQGQALKNGLHLSLNCSITESLSQHKLFSHQQQNLLIASLASFEVFDLADFHQRCKTPNYPWLKPVAELVNPQEVRLITRGLNQWGRPELELGPIPKSSVAQLFPKFIAITEALRTQTQEKTLQQFKALKFTQCLRAETHYDLTCQRILLSE